MKIRCQRRRPGLPGGEAGWRNERILVERIEPDLEGFAHFLPAPADDMEGLGRRRQAIGALMPRTGVFGPGRQAMINSLLQALIQLGEIGAKLRLQGRDVSIGFEF